MIHPNANEGSSRRHRSRPAFDRLRAGLRRTHRIVPAEAIASGPASGTITMWAQGAKARSCPSC